jgi:hypothetical protein
MKVAERARRAVWAHACAMTELVVICRCPAALSGAEI